MSQKQAIAIGTLNRKMPFFAEATSQGPGLASALFDPGSGSIELIDTMPGIDNPAFLSVHPRLPVVHVTSEVHGWHEGVVSSVAINSVDLRLSYLNKQPSLGNCTSHLSYDRTGRFLLATNYQIGAEEHLPGKSVVSFELDGNGAARPSHSAISLSGQGPVSHRQEHSHAHCVFSAPDNRHVLVADLGADTMTSIPFNAETGELGLSGHRTYRLPAGSGPRHFLIHPDGHVVYLLNELSGTLVWFDLAADGGLTVGGQCSTRHSNANGGNDSSDLQLTPDGRFLYAANRGDDTIAIFAISAGGVPEPLGHEPVSGHWPRNLAISPDGGWLLVSNQYSEGIAVFAIDRDSGRLRLQSTFTISSPMCVKFLGEVNSHFK